MSELELGDAPSKTSQDGPAQPHTPGPWAVSILSPYLVVADLSNGMVVNVGAAHILQNDGREKLAERRANARLIAAAPELLDALKYAVGRLECIPEDGRSIGQCNAIEQGHAAIAKAQGRSNG